MPPPPSLRELTAVFARIGVLSFGGPAAQIALMHRELVDKKGWLDEQRFLNALSFCMLLPGPEAMQLATYSGWRIHGVIGGLIAGLLFVLPGAAVIAVLATVYGFFGSVPLVAAVFLGVKATVVIIVLQALLRVAQRALLRPVDWAIAGVAFVAIFLIGVPFPLIILGAAIWGSMLPQTQTVPPDTLPRRTANTLSTLAVWIAIWAFPLGILYVLNADLLLEIGLFFSKLALVSFGGAYAVLAYMTQEVVADYGWISTQEMLDGLGLAETTPGPLILVTQFVGFLAGFREGGLGLGLLAALITLWVTFAPCFLWIFAGAPYIEALTAQPRLKGALSAITAAVVGVMLNLSIWFAVHVFFKDVGQIAIGPINTVAPVLQSFDVIAAGLALFAAALLLRLRLDLLYVLGAAAFAGLILGITGLV